jgi:hypothetical protein
MQRTAISRPFFLCVTSMFEQLDQLGVECEEYGDSVHLSVTRLKYEYALPETL